MATAIRNSDRVKGIFVNKNQIKIGQYADDTFLFLNGTNTALNESLNIIKSFYEYSELTINMEKTLSIWLGKERKIGKEYKQITVLFG